MKRSRQSRSKNTSQTLRRNMSLLTSTATSGSEDQTDSGIDWSPSPDDLQPDGYPVPLYVLAAYMRDGTWLDLRTEDGPVRRARITEIVVRTRGEDVHVRQEWLEDVGEDDCKRCRHDIALDADAIWKAEPTHFELEEVQPYGLKIEWLPERQTDEEMGNILTVVIRAALQYFSLAMDELQATTGDNLTQRYATMITLFEMTDLSARQICEALGYASPTPLISAQNEVRFPGRNHPDLKSNVAGLAVLAQRTLGSQPRRSLPPPRNYSWVLAR